MVRTPPDFAFSHFRFSEVLLVQDSGNQCIRAPVGKSLPVNWGMPPSLRMWWGEAEEHIVPKLDDGYERSILEFGDVESSPRDTYRNLACPVVV